MAPLRIVRAVALGAAVLGASATDCHTHGLSKSTYATSPDVARRGAHLLMRALNLTASRDSFPADTATCPAGTSGTSDDWSIVMGRLETLTDPATAGACYVAAESSSGTAATTTVENATRAVPPTFGSGADCSYDGGAVGRVAYSYVVPAHSPDGCCKACALDADCAEAWYAPGPEDQTSVNFVGECFGLHITAVDAHSSAPGASVADVEAAFDAKLGTMAKFDWFLDYNTAFFTRRLDAYLATFDSLDLKWLPASWTRGGETFYSAFIHVPGSQLVVELVAFDSARIAAMGGDRVMFAQGSTFGFRPAVTRLEPRMTDARIAQFRSVGADDPRLLVSSIGRAASNLSAVEDFYANGFGAKATADHASEDARRKCWEVPETSADACYTERPESSTAGDFTPAKFEATLRAAHDYWLEGHPACAMDRWADNHYAVDADVPGGFDAFMTWIANHPEVRYTCPDDHLHHHHPHRGTPRGGVHYVFDPTGWGVQVDGPQTVVLPGCGKTFQVDKNNACNGTSPEGNCLYWCNGGACAR